MPDETPTFEPLVVANNFLDDGDAVRRFVTEHGYLFLRQALPPEPVVAIREDILRLLADHDFLDSSADYRAGLWRGPFPTSEQYRMLYTTILRMERFNRFAHHPVILDILARVLRGPVFVHPRKIGRLKYPHDDYDIVGPHQDFFYVRGTPDTYTAWIPLGNIDWSLGGLAVLPGSHRQGLHEHTKEPQSKYMGVWGIPANGPWRSTEYQTGDLLVFHSLLLHQGLPNRSAWIRLSLDYRYQRFEEEIDPASLKPHVA